MYSNSIQSYFKWYGVYLFRKIKCGFDLGKAISKWNPCSYNLEFGRCYYYYVVYCFIPVWAYIGVLACVHIVSRFLFLLCFHVYFILFQGSVSHWIWNLSTFYPNDSFVQCLQHWGWKLIPTFASVLEI